MSEQSRAVELIELSERDQPRCEACGAPTMPVARAGMIWLECSAANRATSRLRRLIALDGLTGHTRRPIMTEADYQHVA